MAAILELGFVLLILLSVSETTLSLRPTGICKIVAQADGLLCEDFLVKTNDLYLLSVQRIGVNSSHPLTKHPVFLYHGIMQGGDIWMMDPLEQSLAIVLARQGYDVWIGNTRSSSYAYGHLHYDRSQKEYWNWSFDDLVDLDLPAMLRFVSATTKKRVHFIGFSQGAMVGFAAFTRNRVSRLVEKAVMLSPVVYMKTIRSNILKMAANFFLDQLDLAKFVTGIMDMACQETNLDCKNNTFSIIEGPSSCLSNSTTYYDKYQSQQTSMKNVAQMAQMIRSGRFSRYDYGVLGNMIHYLRTSPPSYNLWRLPKTLPLMLAIGGHDYLVDLLDVRHMRRDIHETVDLLYVPTFSHGDFLLGACSALVDVYPKVHEFLKKNKF